MAPSGVPQADKAVTYMAEILAKLNGEIRALVTQLDTERGGAGLISDKQALANAARVRQQILALVAERQGQVIDVLEQGVAAAADAVAAANDLGDFSAQATRTLQEIADGRADEVAAAFQKGQRQIAEAIAVGLTTGADLSDLIDQVAREVDTSFARAQSAVDTGIVGAGRAVTMRAGREADTDPRDPIVFRYVGPNDSKTRPFCRPILGQCFSDAAISRLDNGQGLAVDTFGGGYGCRHSWSPILTSEARLQGYTIVG